MVGHCWLPLAFLLFSSPVLLSCAGSTDAATDSSPVGVTASTEPDSTSPTDDPNVKNIYADYAFDVDTLEAWVTYGDVFVTFTVTKVEPVPLSKDDAERSEGVLTESYLTA